jgi:predicted SprT family Zn-dependent metalloprotease
MQLDFLNRLTAWARRDLPADRAKPEPLSTDKETALTLRARQLARELSLEALARRVRVTFNSRMRSTAGRANHARALITLNPRLFDFGKIEVDLTFLHELAHLVAHERAGRRRIAPHGKEWKRACRDLGIPNEKRCHNLPLPRREVPRKHLYRCPACHAEIKRVRPFRARVACLACCRKEADGRYDDRFRLVKSPPA